MYAENGNVEITWHDNKASDYDYEWKSPASLTPPHKVFYHV